MNNTEKIFQDIQLLLYSLSIESELHIKDHNYIQIRMWPVNNYVELSFSDLQYIKEISGYDKIIVSSSLGANRMLMKLENEPNE